MTRRAGGGHTSSMGRTTGDIEIATGQDKTNFCESARRMAVGREGPMEGGSASASSASSASLKGRKKFFFEYSDKLYDLEQFKIIEYPLILLFIVSGAIFLISTSDLVSIFLSIELQSYGLYLLSTIYRNSELATNGGLTYFLLGALSSCFILFGISLIYANSGTTNLDGLYIITSLSDLSNGFETNNVSSYWYKSDYINYSLLIISVGFLFKISAAPFHF